MSKVSCKHRAVRKMLVAAMLSVPIIASGCAMQRAHTDVAVCRHEPVAQAVARYAEAIHKMDTTQTSAFYMPDGVLSHANGAPLVGPLAIKKLLDGFAAYTVISQSMPVDQVLRQTTGWRVTGHYVQHVRLPEGNEVEASGRYESDWVCASQEGWRLARLHTY